MVVSAAASGWMDPVRVSQTKIKMTSPWRDYLLCQLTSGKSLSTIECLPPELLDPILDELHKCSIDGLRAFAQVSRTCRALASPYRFKPLRVNIYENDPFLDTDVPNPASVLLSYCDEYKVLKVHSPSNALAKDEPMIEDILKAEDSFECIEYLLDEKWLSNSLCYNNIHLVLEVFSESCPGLSRLIVDLGFFYGFSPGWDREYRESIALSRGISVNRLRRPQCVGQRLLRTLASSQNLRHLTVHFNLEGNQVALMHPGQSQIAVREMYHELEKCKEGIPLAHLDVVFYTSLGNICGCFPCPHPREKARIAVSYQRIDKPGQEPSYTMDCDNYRLGKLMECRRSTEELYGLGMWQNYFGLLTCKLWRGRPSRLTGIPLALFVQIVLFPSIFKPTQIKKCGKRELFCA